MNFYTVKENQSYKYNAEESQTESKRCSCENVEGQQNGKGRIINFDLMKSVNDFLKISSIDLDF